MVIQNSKADVAILVSELRFFKYLMEELGYMSRRIAERSTTQCSQHERIMTMTKPYTQDSTHLVFGCIYQSISNMSCIFHSRTVDTGYRNEGEIFRIIHQFIAMLFILTEQQCVWSIYTTEITVQRIAFACLYWSNVSCVPFVTNKMLCKLIKRLKDICATEERFFLRSSSRHHTSSWISTTCHIQYGRTVAIMQKADTFCQTIHITDYELCFFCSWRNIVNSELSTIEYRFMLHVCKIRKQHTSPIFCCVMSLIDYLYYYDTL